MKTSSQSKVKISDKRPGKITLAAHQDISIISNLHGRLKKCANRQVDVNMIAENVESIDTSTLQLLTSFIRQIHHNGNKVCWQSVSQSLLDSSRLTGLETELLLQSNLE